MRAGLRRFALFATALVSITTATAGPGGVDPSVTALDPAGTISPAGTMGLAAGGGLVRVAEDKALSRFWGFELSLPGIRESPSLDGGNIKQLLALERQIGGEPSPTKTLRLTLRVEEFNERVDAQTCLERLLKPRLERLGADQRAAGGAPPRILFTAPLPPHAPPEFRKYVSRHGYAYYARDWQCFELHGSVLFDPKELRSQAVDGELSAALAALRLAPRAPGMLRGATLNRMAKPPLPHGDPAGYLQLGGAYLHDPESPNPEKAAHYYRLALELGSIEAPGRWLAREGLGLAFLKLDHPREAAAEFERAVAAAEEGGKPASRPPGPARPSASPGVARLPALGPDQVSSSLFNLACARARAAEVAAAQRALERMLALARRDPERRRKALSDIGADPDLEALRSAPGFAAWVKGLKAVAGAD